MEAVKVVVRVSYNGEDPESFEGPPNQPLRAVFRKALTFFKVRPADQSNLGLFHAGNELNLDTKLGDLNLPEDAVVILQARRAGGGYASPLTVLASVRRETEEHLRRCGRSGHECVVLWAAARGPVGDPRTVERLFHPKHGMSPHLYEIGPGDLYVVNEELLRSQLSLVAQVHSHPGAAFHSPRDDEGPAVHFPGFLSIVVPNFGREGLNPRSGLYAAEYQGDGEWRTVPQGELSARVAFQR